MSTDKEPSGFNSEDFLFLDFEFNQITSENVNLVSCVTYSTKTKKTKKFWLHRNFPEHKKLKDHLMEHRYISGYSCVAEARCFYSLNLDPLAWEWLDLYLEYKMLSNHNDKLNWGAQLVDGKVKKVSKPRSKWERTEEESKSGFKPTHSLAEATFKLTGQIRDTEEKQKCRDLIISNPAKFTNEGKESILKYNAADVEFLPEIFNKIKENYASLLASDEIDWDDYRESALWRGRYSAHTAIMESIGYPIDYDATKNFSKQIPAILAECQRDINEQFKDAGIQPFKWDRLSSKFVWNQKTTREWVQKQGYNEDNWLLTDKDQLSLSLEAFERHFQFKHDYPRGNFGAQMVRFLKLKQSLYGFAESDGKRKSFWSSVGPDKRVRPYMNIYGAQSGRSQPAATGFMFLKPAWMRALVQPPKGKLIAGIDYGQQEFFLAGLESGDNSMINAYLSGDPYLYMGQSAGFIPPEGTRKTHERERDLMKSTTLGILFGMTKTGLSAKLTADSGEEYTEQDAQELIDAFEAVYPDYIEWRQDLLIKYRDGEAISTLDGWTLWPDNDNPRSVLNVPIQGAGAAIMRKAVDIAVDAGCRVIFTLHDAIYIEANDDQEEHILKLYKAMLEAFAFFYEGGPYEAVARKIKLDPKAWGDCFEGQKELLIQGLSIPVSKNHIDSRAQADYDRFSKYFSKPDTDDL